MTSFIAELKRRLQQADLPLVVSALRNQAQLWADLQQSEFSAQALEAAAGNRDYWSPAYLGLLRLNQAPQFEALRATPMQAVGEKLRYQAASAYEQLAAEGLAEDQSIPDLAQAALLALALRERRRLLNGWEQLPDDLSIAPAEFWKLPLACLFGLTPNPQELLACLLSPNQNTDLHLLGLHALVSNPLPLDQQSSHLLEIIAQFDLPQFLTVLRHLARLHTPLAQQAALLALENLQDHESKEVSELSQIERLMLQAEIHQIGGQSGQATPLLSAAWEASQRLQSDLAAKLADSAAQDRDAVVNLAALQESGELIDPKKLRALNSAKDYKSPTALLAAARVALKSGDSEEAESMAKAALQAARKSAELAQYEAAAWLRQLGELFIDLQLPLEARQAAQLAMESSPNDAEGAAFLNQVLNITGDFAEALQAAHLAAALAPQRGDLRRLLAKSLQADGEPREALTEWQTLLESEQVADIEDLLSCAEAALLCGETQTCIEVCQRALSEQATNGVAHTLIGKALLAQGEDSSALEHLHRATELAPAHLEAWLALAQQQRAKGAAADALDSLLAAQQFAAPSAALQSMLGEIYLSLSRHEEALTAFKRAAELSAGQADKDLAARTALQLSALLYELGQRDEGRRVLEQAHQRFPAHAELALEYAKLLLANGEPKPALAALNIALVADPENIEVLVDAARAQLAAGEDPAEAERMLKKVTGRKDAPLEAQALFAEALAAQGKHVEAEFEFEAALDSDLIKDPAWKKRVVLGKALSQAANGQGAAAIAALEKMDKSQPGDLDILRALCAVYQQAHRPEEAFQIAHKVYLGAPQDEQTLLWYADQVQGLGKAEEARKALSKAAKASSSPQLVHRLAGLLWENEDKAAALDSLANLLSGTDGAALLQAGHFLMEKDAAVESIPYFKRAIETTKQPEPALLAALTKAYEESGQLSEALDNLEEEIQLVPHRPQGLAKKAELLQRLGRPQAALETLDQALDLLPEDVNLLSSKANLLRANQDWSAALDLAEKALSLDGENLQLLQTASELALACLQPERARAHLAQMSSKVPPTIEMACLQAELALEANEELEAAKALAPVLDSGEDHPRVLALQARLAARRGDMAEAEQLFAKAVQISRELPKQQNDIFSQIGLARAAQKLNDWVSAVDLLKAVSKDNPAMALAQFSLGKALVQCAEWEQLCEASQAKIAAHQTGDSSKEIQAAFAAAKSIASSAPAQALIEHWQAHAELRLAADVNLSELPKGYPNTAGEAAALLFAARRQGIVISVEERVRAFHQSPDALVERALASSDQDTQSALKWMQAACEQNPLLAPYHALAAIFAHRLNETEQALQHITRALALSPGQPSWLALAGDLQSRSGSLLEAVEAFKQAVQLEPGEARHAFNLGQAQLAARLFADALASLQQAAQLQPKNQDYVLALAKAYRQAGDLTQAKAKAAQAHKLAPQAPAALLLQAELALEEKDAQTAKAVTEQALKLAPKDVEALRVFAESLNALGQVEDAIAVLERATEHAGDPVALLVRRAQLLGENGGLSEIVKLSQLYPDRAEVFFALSEILALAGDFKEAIQAAQRAAKKSVEHLPRESQARIHLHLGQLLKHSGQLDQSLHHLDEAAQLAPHLLESHIERGRVFLARRQQGQAMEAFKQAASVAPHEALPHFEAGLALKEAKDYGAAENELRQAAKLAPKNRQIQRQLAAVIALNLVHQPQETEMAR